jgi:hypothetical protein
LRPAAVVPNVGAIHPGKRLTLATGSGALQRVVRNVETKNYLVAFDAISDAISNVSVHGTIPINLWRHFAIVLRKGKLDESKWQGGAADTK